MEQQRLRDAAYRKFILNLYHATPVSGHAWLHGMKSSRMVHVGAVDAPVTLSDIRSIAREVWKASNGSGEGRKAAADILGWEFAFELNETAIQIAAESRVDVVFKKIPHEVLEKKAVEQGDIKFFELGALADIQADLLDVTSKLRTAPCVPALREAVKAWVAGGYKGITDTTRILLNYWFHADHKLATGRPFRYHRSQQEAIETLVFVWEFEKVRSRKGLLQRYATDLHDVALPPYDDFARYCIKMATGSGKTKVMSLAIAWQYLNAVREQDAVAKDYAKTFLLIAPNVIVLERLKLDFSGGRVFRSDPVIPRELEIFWDFDCVMRGEAEKAPTEGMLFLTNIQQFYDRPDRNGDAEPDVMTAVLGQKPPTKKLDLTDFDDRILY